MSSDASTELATRADLKAEFLAIRKEFAQLKVELIMRNVGTMAVLTALCAAIVKLG